MATFELILENWSSRQTREFLQLKRRELGSRAFARGFQQQALSDAERLFPHFERCLLPGKGPWDVITREWLTVAGLDLAGKGRRGTCLFILAVSPGSPRVRVPVSVELGAWNSRQIAERVVSAIHTWNIRHTKVEDNSLQDSFIELIRLVDPTVELSGFTTSWNKRDPEIGLPSLDREFEMGIWKVPWPHAGRDCNCDYCLWIHQMKAYPAVESADSVMATWFAREAALELGPGFSELAEDSGGVLGWGEDSRWRLGETFAEPRPRRWEIRGSHGFFGSRF